GYGHEASAAFVAADTTRVTAVISKRIDNILFAGGTGEQIVQAGQPRFGVRQESLELVSSCQIGIQAVVRVDSYRAGWEASKTTRSDLDRGGCPARVSN